jgi:CDP-diacylglycerol--serine O-phosphatidyltransferase
MKQHIPNFVTSLNLLSGCIGVVFALQGQWAEAGWCMLLSGVADFLDGLVARALKVSSEMGKQLDSLADVVSFGLLPGALYFDLLSQYTQHDLLPYAGFLITVFSAWRLAKFNIDTRQSTDFIGLNTPMNAFYTFSLVWMAPQWPLLQRTEIILLCIAVSCVLLVSEIRLFSMKLKGLAWKDNRYKYIFLALALLLLIGLGISAMPIILGSYLLASWLHFKEVKA